MKNIQMTVSATILAESELTSEERALLGEARLATLRSYAPYSRFCVGAAVELDDGTLVGGSNQENAAYPSGLCAERVAVFQANSNKPDIPIRRICVSARHADSITPVAITPCGACRQVLLEAEVRAGHDIEVLLDTPDGVYRIPRAADLLPLAFNAENLNG